MSFQQSLSGLSAASTSLDTIGNNIANANTVGFKQGTAEFADIYANSLSGAGAANQVGSGVKVSHIAQSFNQGNITTTSNPLNVAISGAGFFRTDTNGTINYSRDGQLEIDNKGYLINSTGARITGYPTDGKGTILSGATTDLQLNTGDVSPQPTATIKAQVNLNANTTVPATTPTFNPADPTTYTNSTSTTVFDSLGDNHTLTTYYQLSSTPGQWKVYATLDGAQIPTPAVLPSPATPVATLNFDSTGGLVSSTPAQPVPLTATLNNGANNFSATLDLTGSTQYGANFAVASIVQDGHTTGQLTGFNISSNGVIEGNYSNGTTQAIGQFVLVNFADVNGLQPIGNNTFAQTAASGQPLVSTPGSGTLGTLQGSALEASNVDLTTQLVDLITAQRSYQADAQSIKTQDQILQVITSLQ